jgi:hypothetical protein
MTCILGALTYPPHFEAEKEKMLLVCGGIMISRPEGLLASGLKYSSNKSPVDACKRIGDLKDNPDAGQAPSGHFQARGKVPGVFFWLKLSDLILTMSTVTRSEKMVLLMPMAI